MEKLQMCRICLVKNVRMYAVVNRNLHELYEKLTDIPFVTEDSRPILACFFCYTKLKQCYRLLRQCLEVEEQFAQMMNEDYEPDPLINLKHLQCFSGFIKSPIVHMNIGDECQKLSIAIKEEIPDVCEGLDYIIEPKVEYQSDELEPEILDNSCLDIADIPPQRSESDLDDDVPLIEFKTEVVEEEVSKKKRRARETKWATVAKKLKLDTRKIKLENAVTAEQTTKEKSDSKVIQTTQKHTSEPGTYFKEPDKCDQRSFNRVIHKCDVCQHSFSHKNDFTKHIRIHTGVKPYKCDVCQRTFNQSSHLTIHMRKHTGEKPYKCDVCQRSFNNKSNLTNHIRKHTGEKPYKCDRCQQSFSRKNNLTRHILIHTGNKPYNCDVCQRSFTQKGDLTRHILIHTGEKSYKCDVCQRGFSRNDDLKKHIRTHTGERPYKCGVCQRSFNQKIHLTNHIRIIHTGEKPDLRPVSSSKVTAK